MIDDLNDMMMQDIRHAELTSRVERREEESMYYLMIGGVIYSAHRSLEKANEKRAEMEKTERRTITIRTILEKWEPGDNPAPRYWIKEY